MRKTFLIIIILILGVLFADPFEPLNIDFLKLTSKKNDVPLKKVPSLSNKKTDLPAYQEVIKDLEVIEGLFLIYWDIL